MYQIWRIYFDSEGHEYEKTLFLFQGLGPDL